VPVLFCPDLGSNAKDSAPCPAQVQNHEVHKGPQRPAQDFFRVPSCPCWSIDALSSYCLRGESSKIHYFRRNETKKSVLFGIANTNCELPMNQSDPIHPRKRHVIASISLALAGSLWGTGFLFGKIAMGEMTVAENVTFRFLAGAAALTPIVVRHWTPYRGKDLALLLLASVIGVPVQFLVQFKGLQLTTVSHASLIVGVLPMLLALSSALFLHERLRYFEWGLLGGSALGAMLIALSSSSAECAPQPSLPGDLLVLMSLCGSTAMILLSKRLIATHGALPVTASTIIFGTIMLLAWVELTQPLHFHFSPTAWGAAAAQGLLATAGAYLCWNWGLSHMPAARAGVFLNLEPVVGTVLGVMILHERLGEMAIVGGLLIIGAAVYFSVRPREA
jgi:drug/metabolite transporter (DMT)-like permease